MLTAVAVQTASAREKDYKRADSGGLYLFVTKKGHKSWRLKYRFGGKEKRLVLGVFPHMSLAEARIRRDEARRQLRDGVDPALKTKQAKLARATPSAFTLEVLARAWHKLQAPRWSARHANDVIHSLERDVFRELGRFDMQDIDGTMLHAVLAKVEERGAVETAQRLRQRVSEIYRYAKVKLSMPTLVNPAADLDVVMQKVPRGKRRPALLHVPALQELLRVVDRAGASPITKLGSRFVALTAQRPGMVHRLRWPQIENVDWSDSSADVSNALWRVPATEMKQEFNLRGNDAYEHVVPLAPQAVEVLRQIRRLTGNAIYIFPSGRSSLKPMSENAIGYLYNREGYKGRHCPHGWRSSFSTIMNERYAALVKSDEAKAFHRLVIDLMLAHLPKGVSETERIYNRAAYMDRRREIAVEWADLLLAGLDDAAALLEGPRRRYRE